MQRTYELMFIVRPDMLEEDQDKLISNVETQVGNAGGSVKSVERMGKRRLAYTVRKFQDETNNGLFSFLCWTYKPYNNELGGSEISSREYLKHLALCRIFLDNIRHIRTSVLTQNANALTGLRYGANDFDIPWEDEVTQMAGAVIEQDIERVLGYARDQGFKTVCRHVANARKTESLAATR